MAEAALSPKKDPGTCDTYSSITRRRCLDGPAPLLQHLMEFLGLLGHLFSQIVFLARIVLEVVQFEVAVVEEFKQLPVAFANGAARAAAQKVRSG